MENRNGAETPRNWHPMEYAHVFLWLVKDLCWAQDWKMAGTLMVVPTVGVALWITWLQRRHPLTLVHNISISLWISCNSLWMLAEFYEKEHFLKPIATAGFILGIALLAAQYIRLAVSSGKKKQESLR